MNFSLADAQALAMSAHAEQFDKGGAPYFKHVSAVAQGLAHLSEHMQMAGYLHDIIEDTDYTADDLIALGVPASVVRIVVAVSRNMYPEDFSYMDMVRAVAKDEEACLVKISDNAHNSLPERKVILSEKQRKDFDKRYGRARRVLYIAAGYDKVKAILLLSNRHLIPELDAIFLDQR